MTEAPVGAAVLVGALAQRATGMGFAMIAAPSRVIALGASSGVVLVQMCGVVVSAGVLLVSAVGAVLAIVNGLA